MNKLTLLAFYPRAWRERYGEELLELLDDRVRPRDVVDVMHGAANEWMRHMTGIQFNERERRSTRALAQAAVVVILFQTLVPATVSALRGQHLLGTSTFNGGLLFGLFTGFVWSAAVLGPVAFLSALINWREVPFARVAAVLLTALIAFQIGSHAAWGPVVPVLVLAAIWIGYRSASIEPDAAALA
jgi:hypothetical protein